MLEKKYISLTISFTFRESYTRNKSRWHLFSCETSRRIWYVCWCWCMDMIKYSKLITSSTYPEQILTTVNSVRNWIFFSISQCIPLCACVASKTILYVSQEQTKQIDWHGVQCFFRIKFSCEKKLLFLPFVLLVLHCQLTSIIDFEQKN